MKSRLLLLVGIILSLSAARGQTPVSWSYTARHISGQLFEIHLTAIMQEGWHIYSQHQPKEAIAVPTSFKYIANPLLTLQGPVKEEGKIIHYQNKEVGVSQDQYAQRVDFVQIVRVKATVKTRINGTIRYQACTDEQCLKAADTDFSIDLSPGESGR